MLKSIRNNKRSLRVRRKIKKVSSNRYRISIHRSTKNIFAQIIDDINSKTLVSASSLKDKIDGNKKKMDSSAYVAKVLAKKAIEKKITRVYFDRGSYKYHGRVKIFAETLRKNGLTF